MRRIALLVLVALLAACGGDDDGDDAASGEEADAGETGTTLDESPFCVTIRALEQMGSEPAQGSGTPEEVLSQNDEIIAHLEDAQASTPADAPPDVPALFDDYLALSAAITTAAGDTDAAFAALQAQQPELVTRLSAPDAHNEAFRWFSERCGTAPPG
jgi:ABC-type glycerol-3-phosphate transport system substrate-binding protein